MGFGSRRISFTVIELMVVLAIIGLLIALLLSAVQRVREAANRMTCLSRLKELGLALQGYHDIHRVFPSGISGDGEGSRYPFLSWNARILPFLEQRQLWRAVREAYAQDRDFRNVPPHVHRATVVLAFSCPSDGRASRPSTLVRSAQVAFTSYLGVEGTSTITSTIAKNGMLYMGSHVRMADVADGTSNTLFVGERPPCATERLGWWYAGWGQDRNGSAEMVLGVLERNVYYSECPPGPYKFGPGRIGNPCDVFHYWSPHGGGGNFLLVDGSARLIPYTASAIMPALATRAGHEAVNEPQ